MKKFIIASVCIGMSIVSCDKTKKAETCPTNVAGNQIEFSNIKNTNKRIGVIDPIDLFTNHYTFDLLKNQGLSVETSSDLQVYDSQQPLYLYYRKLIKTNPAPSTDYTLFFYSSNENITSLPLLCEMETTLNSRKITYRSLINNVVAGTLILDLNNKIISINGNPPLGIMQDSDKEKPCTEKTKNFSDCFVCAWNELNNDALGVITCIAMPYCCAAACGIACAAFHTVPHHDGLDRYDELNKNVDDLIAIGKYTGKSTFSYNHNKFIFLY